MRIVLPSAVLEAITPDAALLIERAGRTCYKSEDRIAPGTAAQFIKMLRGKQHESVLEHASATFRIVADRGVSHELVRHRIASFSQESTRYCCYAKDAFGNEISVIEPPGLRDALGAPGGAWNDWYDAGLAAERAYFQLLERGLTPQIARSVLPNCLKTELVMSANFREWLHVIRLRTSSAAHPQMREIAVMIEASLKGACPEVFDG